MKKMLAIMLGLSLLVGLCSGCVKAAAMTDLTAGYTSSEPGTKAPEGAEQTAAAFALRLFQAAGAGGEENPVLSPLSVLLALGMVANGASGETKDAFEAALAESGLTVEQINALCKSMTDACAEPGGSTKIRIANAIWIRDGFKVEPQFLQKNADWYGAGAFTADFSDDKTVKQINEWVSNRTEGLIGEMVSKLDPDTVMLLMNTVYMNNTWSRTFDPEDTRDDVFSKADGSLLTVPFLHNGKRQEQYISTGKETGVLLPYDDGRYGFLALLPEEGVSVRDYVAALHAGEIKTLLDGAEKTNLDLSLPKFEAEYAVSLNSALTELGLGVAFDPNRADFSGISKGQGLYIQEVFHRAVLKVNEKGTEAAAATGISVGVTSMPVDQFIKLTFDRPFVYAIVDLETGFPLFLGAMENPA